MPTLSDARPFDRPTPANAMGSLLRCPHCQGRGWHLDLGPVDWAPLGSAEHAATADCQLCAGTGALPLPPCPADLLRWALAGEGLALYDDEVPAAGAESRSILAA